MIQPDDLKADLPVDLANDVVSHTGLVWDVLLAGYQGDIEKIQCLVEICPELAYAQYNYAPPIHFAVREGHRDLVNYLLGLGAWDPDYRTYPFGDSLVTTAEERGFEDIMASLKSYMLHPERQKFSGHNGRIHFSRTKTQQEFEDAVDQNNIVLVTGILQENPGLAKDNTFFWGEGILAMPVKEGAFEMVDLLIRHGANVPAILKWAQAYYFETFENALYILKKGMSADTMSWHHVRLLHNVAQQGDIQKADVLLRYGAGIDVLEEEYQSTPLGLAARWGHTEMVSFLLKKGANPGRSGAIWSTPLCWAVKKNHTEIELLLRRAGAKR